MFLASNLAYQIIAVWMPLLCLPYFRFGCRRVYLAADKIE